MLNSCFADLYSLWLNPTTLLYDYCTQQQKISLQVYGYIHCCDINYFKEQVLLKKVLLLNGFIPFPFVKPNHLWNSTNIPQLQEHEKITFTDKEINEIVNISLKHNKQIRTREINMLTCLLQHSTLQKVIIALAIKSNEQKCVDWINFNLTWFCELESNKFDLFTQYYANVPKSHIADRSSQVTKCYKTSPIFKSFFIEWINRNMKKLITIITKKASTTYCNITTTKVC